MKRKLRVIPFLALMAISVLVITKPSLPSSVITEGINSIDVSWVLTAYVSICISVFVIAFLTLLPEEHTQELS